LGLDDLSYFHWGDGDLICAKGERACSPQDKLEIITDNLIEKYSPNVVEGIKKLSKWAKNL